jgi:hypothetical protein
MHVVRESTVVAGPVCGWHYIEINAYAESKCELQNEYVASRISNCVSYIIGLSPIGFSNTVTTRETECVAYHESIAAGSPSDEGAVRGGHGGLPPCGEARRGKALSERNLWLKRA